MWYIMWYTSKTTINQNFIDSTRYEIYAEMCGIRVAGFRYLDDAAL